jgi:hypothetical protein
MFAVAFPLALLMAYVTNIFEIKSDFQKLRQCKRPIAGIRY